MTPAILGLRGTGSFTTDERPLNWREMILALFPNGEAPLTAIMAMLKSEGTDSAQYNWWEKRLPTQRMRVAGNHHAANTTIVVASGAKDAVKGTILLVERTNELLKVVSDPITDTAVEVERSYGAIATTNINNDDFIIVVGNVHPEGAKVPTARSYAPVKRFNYTEIFRTALYLTRTGRRETLRWDRQGPYREAKREALSLHSIEMEKALIFGEPVEGIGDNGQLERMTGGVLNFIRTNKGTTAWGGVAGLNADFDVGGTLSEEDLDKLLEEVFRYGSTEKLALVGSTFLRAIATLAKHHGTVNLVPRDQTYGMKIVEYFTPHGTLMLKSHPLFNQHPEWRKNALILDPQNLIWRHVDDTRFIKNRQDNGEDASKDEYLTEGGLEVHFEETHAYITGVTGADIT